MNITCWVCGTVFEAPEYSEIAFCPNCDSLIEIVDDSEDDESLSVDEAADIWASSGMDEDYMFGYSDGELRGSM